MDEGRWNYLDTAEFVKTFFNKGDALSHDHIAFELLKNIPEEAFTKSETLLYPYLCKVIDAALTDTNLEIRDTGSWFEKDPSAISKVAVDLTFYDAGSSGHRLTAVEQTRSKANKERLPWASRMKFGLARSFIEVKTCDLSKVAFGGSNSEESRLARGQLCEYMAEMMVRQHRLSAFAITIHRRTAYLMYWDRAGVVVSHGFDYTKDPEMLLNVLHRLGNMNPTELGYDPTVQATSEDDPDVIAMRTFEPELPVHQRLYKEAFETNWPISRVMVTDPNGKEHSIITGRYRHASTSPFGRATKGSVAYDLRTNKLVFHKSSYRSDTNDTTPESTVILKLQEHGVRNITTVVYGGDVYSPAVDGISPTIQRTRAQRYLKAYQTPHIHHRVVLAQVCRHVHEYVNAQELVNVMFDVGCAHEDAWDKLGILHRDVSSNNVLIDDDHVDPETGERCSIGLLNDWDMHKTREQLDNPPSRGNRSGTWVFMSAINLQYPKKPYSVSDDIESFVHLFSWLTMRYHLHSMSHDPVSLETTLHGHFEMSRTEDGVVYGSRQKFDAMQEGRMPFKLNRDVCPNLGELLDKLMILCKNHYAAVDFDALAPYGDPKAFTTPKVVLHPKQSKTSFRSKRTSSQKSSLRQVTNVAAQHSYPPVDAVEDNTSVIPILTIPSKIAPSTTIPSTTAGSRDLDTHHKFLDILLEAAESDGWAIHDKVPDQFAGLCAPGRSGIPKPTTQQTGATLDPESIQSSGSKRKAEDDVCDSPTRKQKTSESTSKSRSAWSSNVESAEDRLDVRATL